MSENVKKIKKIVKYEMEGDDLILNLNHVQLLIFSRK